MTRHAEAPSPFPPKGRALFDARMPQQPAPAPRRPDRRRAIATIATLAAIAAAPAAFGDYIPLESAEIRVEGRSAIVKGVERLSGAEVSASDLRAGAALVVVPTLIAWGQIFS